MECPDCLGSGHLLKTAEFAGDMDGSTEFEGKIEYITCPRCAGSGKVAETTDSTD